MKSYTEKSIESHPFGLLYIPDNAATLFVGSFPTTKKNHAMDFFYPNPTNRFWELLNRLYSNGNPALLKPTKENKKLNPNFNFRKEREFFCNKHHIGLTVIISRAFRMDDSSDDEQLYVAEYNDIFEILKSHQKINKILLTGKGGSSVHYHFYQYLVMNKIKFTYDLIDEIFISKLLVKNRKIKVYSLPTTSSRSSKNEANEKLYKKAILEEI
jgi:G:T/U-mismatch repair DNA glycosylase